MMIFPLNAFLSLLHGFHRYIPSVVVCNNFYLSIFLFIYIDVCMHAVISSSFPAMLCQSFFYTSIHYFDISRHLLDILCQALLHLRKGHE